MAYLDEQTAYFTPQWWTSAVYKYVPGYGYKFQKFDPYQLTKAIDYQDRVMSLYSDLSGYATYPYYWDPVAGTWMRYAAGIGPHPKVSGEIAMPPALVGALERRSPLPVGRYWQDIFVKQSKDWDAWVKGAMSAGAFTLIKHEVFAGDPDGSVQARDWFLFEITKPIDWPALKLGYPTVADDAVKTSADTATNPPGPSPAEIVEDALASAGKAAGDAGLAVLKPVAWGLGVVLGIKLLWELRRK